MTAAVHVSRRQERLTTWHARHRLHADTRRTASTMHSRHARVQTMSELFMARREPLETIVTLAEELRDYCPKFTSEVRHALDEL